jgi:hypothetical protein
MRFKKGDRDKMAIVVLFVLNERGTCWLNVPMCFGVLFLC